MRNDWTEAFANLIAGVVFIITIGLAFRLLFWTMGVDL